MTTQQVLKQQKKEVSKKKSKQEELKERISINKDVSSDEKKMLKDARKYLKEIVKNCYLSDTFSPFKSNEHEVTVLRIKIIKSLEKFSKAMPGLKRPTFKRSDDTIEEWISYEILEVLSNIIKLKISSKEKEDIISSYGYLIWVIGLLKNGSDDF